MYGDPLLNRGFGVLAVDGPGQYESLLGIYMTIENWEATSRACLEWLLRRPEVDPQRVAISGRSFGSFATTLAASNQPRFRAVAESAMAILRSRSIQCEQVWPLAPYRCTRLTPSQTS
jgi:dipeptidyl aminopeptidase/acylaminoacyl peptidase